MLRGGTEYCPLNFLFGDGRTVCYVQCAVYSVQWPVHCTHGQQSERAVRSHQLGGTRGDSRSWHAAHRAPSGSPSEDRGHSEDRSTM